MSSGWLQIQARHRPLTMRMTGSLTPHAVSPAKTVRAGASASPARSAASSASIHQCLLPGVAQQTYSRHDPSGSRTRAGRSSDIAPNWSLSNVTIGSRATPSDDRATVTVATSSSVARIVGHDERPVVLEHGTRRSAPPPQGRCRVAGRTTSTTPEPGTGKVMSLARRIPSAAPGRGRRLPPPARRHLDPDGRPTRKRIRPGHPLPMPPPHRRMT